MQFLSNLNLYIIFFNFFQLCFLILYSFPLIEIKNLLINISIFLLNYLILNYGKKQINLNNKNKTLLIENIKHNIEKTYTIDRSIEKKYMNNKKEIKENGFTIIKSFLNDEFISNTKKYINQGAVEGCLCGEKITFKKLVDDINNYNIKDICSYIFESDKIVNAFDYKLSFNEPKSKGNPMNLHRDYPFNSKYYNDLNNELYKIKDILSIQIFLCISDVNKDNGATVYIKDSFNDNTFYKKKKYCKSKLNYLNAQKGDLILWNSKLVHSGPNENFTDNKRVVILGQYIYDCFKTTKY
uniref:Uncharacterized protein n=1 Tax=viral metagenome TaxID=1070528 RepID=A0A6C0IVW9_9ZZZZ